MDEDNQQRPDTINMLLDIEKFSGEHVGRITPVLVFLLTAGLPVLILMYLFVGKVNLLYFLPFWIVYAIKIGLITVGREAKRVEEFKRQLYDQYSSSLDLMNIKTVHDDGCVEYVNGNVSYYVVATNGNLTDELMRAQIVRKFFIQLNEGYIVDIHVHNIVASDELANRYQGVKLFSDGEAAKDFISLIDHNRLIISNNSLITQVVFIVKAKKKEYRKLKENIETALASEDAKVFRGLKLSSFEEVEVILSRDIDAYVDFQEMQRKKYRSGNYFGSKVAGYDLTEEIKKEDETEERGFMIHE
jgi:hypothetical protein